jgi:hypothetical protein
LSLPVDKRRIQTAMLGSAESDDPLLLPLEAIELDAFRRRTRRLRPPPAAG